MIYWDPELLEYGHNIDPRPHICLGHHCGAQYLYTPVQKVFWKIYINVGRTFPSWPGCFSGWEAQ